MKKTLLLFSLLMSSVLFSQTSGIIEGTIKDATANNSPMMFATVTLKETQQTVTTGFRGGYFFKDLKPGVYTLVFNFLGYESVTKKVEILNNAKNKLMVNALLKPSTDINYETVSLTAK